MLQGVVIGHATATIKHRSLNGWRMVIVQPVGPDGQPESDPQIAVDRHGAAPGQRVILNSDGLAARELIGDSKTPVRFFIIAVVDTTDQ